MDEIDKDSNKTTSILLSRNTPVALVVGAASFLGSHLVDKLLEKGIQVVGIDQLVSGKKENLQKAVENKNFHLMIASLEKIDLDLSRLDYLLIVSSEKLVLDKILDFFKKTRARALLVSSIDLYEKGNHEKQMWLRDAERKIAKFASDFNLNARILRLGCLYGPRMDFQTKDPLVKLIQQALTGDLQKDVSLDFSSRALYVADAVDLIIKTIFAGATAQKIFDGVNTTPVKVSEIKQVLLDPIWYETKDFTPSELPPWPTPNLDKTVKILNWQPKQNLVAGLRATLSYFKDNEITVPRLKTGDEKTEDGARRSEDSSWKEEKREQLEGLRLGKRPQEVPQPRVVKRVSKLQRSWLPLSKVYLVLIISLMTYALIWPTLRFFGGVLTFHYQLNEGFKNLEKGEIERGLDNIKQAEVGAKEAKMVFDTLEPVGKTGFLKGQFEAGDKLLNLSILAVGSAKSTVLGIESLIQSIRAVTGELSESPVGYFNSAQLELTAASEDLSKARVLLENQDFGKNLPGFLSKRITSLSEKLEFYENLTKKARALSILLPKLVASDSSPADAAGKNYLLLLQNNMELRPGGGFIGSFAKISFEGGKLKKLAVNDIYAIDGQLGIHVEPPVEIKEDLGQKDWFLRDSNWEPDFPTNARQAEWFYTKETGERVDGVVALDVSAMEELLSTIGSLDLADYNEKITAENLFEKAVTHAELSFFPGTQAKKSFLTALTNGVFNKIFFLPENNWPAILTALGRSLDGKHISVYLNDPKLFSYLGSLGWTHVFPRQPAPAGSGVDPKFTPDFLSLVEANLGANKANYYLDRSYNLETVVGKDGEIRHRLRVSFTNRSPSDTFPGGRYKNRMRIYLPLGSKMTRVLWAEADITKDVTSFLDYGRSGYSMLLELAPKEQKTLVLDYFSPVKLEFKDRNATYRLDIIKQAGTLKDPLQWRITYPISFQLVSEQIKKVGPQEQTIATDLSRDRSFGVEFKK